MRDEEIIELYLNRSEDAIIETANRYGKYCYIIAYNILKNKEDAEECVNDVLLKMWVSIPPHRPNSFISYLGVITRNLALSRYQYYSTKKRGGSQVLLVFEELRECISATNNIESAINSWYVGEILEEFLIKLNEQNRQIFINRYWYFYSIKEIAEKYNLSENLVKVSLYRSRKKLKHILLNAGIY